MGRKGTANGQSRRQAKPSQYRLFGVPLVMAHESFEDEATTAVMNEQLHALQSGEL
jgi:hypothetical protein